MRESQARAVAGFLVRGESQGKPREAPPKEGTPELSVENEQALDRCHCHGSAEGDPSLSPGKAEVANAGGTTAILCSLLLLEEAREGREQKSQLG